MLYYVQKFFPEMLWLELNSIKQNVTKYNRGAQSLKEHLWWILNKLKLIRLLLYLLVIYYASLWWDPPRNKIGKLKDPCPNTYGAVTNELPKY